jgi:hypothetical protein
MPNRAQRRTVRDARGRRVPAVSVHALAHGDTENDGRRRAIVQRIRQRTKESAWRIAGGNAFWIVIAAVTWSRVEDRIIGRDAFRGIPRVAAIVGLLCLLVGMCWWWASRTAGLRRSRLAVQAGFCGSCGYDLEGLKLQDNGHIICPECGSAWRRRSD